VVSSTCNDLKDVVSVVASVGVDIARPESILGHAETRSGDAQRLNFGQPVQVDHPTD